MKTLKRSRLGKVSRTKIARRKSFCDIADLIGAVQGLPADLSARKKYYLRTTGYGRKRP
jgi:hypothetical protein